MMNEKLDHDAGALGSALGTLEEAAAAAGSRIQQGFTEAADIVSDSTVGKRVEKRAHTVKTSITNKLATAQNSAEKRTAVKKKASASSANKSVEKKATAARKKVAPVKKVAAAKKKAAKSK